jgi:tetratricopeptide (TPR) repeat protein
MKKVYFLAIAVLLIGVIFYTGCQQTAITAAKVYMQQSNYDSAIEQCKAAIEQVPTDAEAYFVLGKAYGHKNMYQEMNEAFTQSMKHSNKYASEISELRIKYWVDLFNYGVSAYRQDRLDEAIKRFKLAILLIPEKVDAYKNLAFSYAQKDDQEAAIQTYHDALQVAPDDLEIKNFLGQLHYSTKKFDKAIEILSEVIEKADPSSEIYSQALLSLAFSYDLTDQPDKAIAAYKSAIKASPDNTDLIFNLGRILMQQKDFDKAIENFQKVIDKKPEDFDALMSIGNCYLNMEKFEEAVPFYEKATEIKPDNIQAWNNLGVAYIRADDEEKGKAAFDKVDSLKAGQQ